MEGPDRGQIRNPILYSVGAASEVPQDHREVGIPGPAVGAVYHVCGALRAQDGGRQVSTRGMRLVVVVGEVGAVVLLIVDL